MRDMVEDDAFKHLSIRSLAIVAQRLGRVFAAYETWCRAIRRYQWNRPRKRVYPVKPKIGIRAQDPGQLLHVDVTVIRLLDGTRTYLHAIQDNYSRRVMAWALQPKLLAKTTRELVRQALKAIQVSSPIQVMTDGGSENLSITKMSEVCHVVAQVDIAQSNSLIESLWFQIRSRWLYLHTLDSFQTLERLIEKYFRDHNELIPRAELGGRTPDEAFFGRENDLKEWLPADHAQARIRRATENRTRTCSACSQQGSEAIM